jgi:RsiW-degrading membrane proteinase PrsW (M82 family)
MNVLAVIAALLIAFVYLNFLRQMDVFEKEKSRYTILVFAFGIIATFLIIPFQYYIPVSKWLPSEGGFFTRLKFHFFAVAIFEEFIKIIPFLLLLRFPKIMDESYDYIKYASVGAMGFATIENILYFNQSYYIIEGRAFYTAILHMFTSSIIAYGMYIVRLRKKPFLFICFLILFLLASFLHALYNALIGASGTYYIGILLIAFMLIVWGRMQNNLLNNSEFFNHDTIQNKVVLAGLKLMIGWAVVFIYAAAAVACTSSISIGFAFFKEGALFGIASGIGLYFALARPRLKKGKWTPLISKKRVY